jgi:alpha-tubulin suppressor-like RCC1 family protein
MNSVIQQSSPIQIPGTWSQGALGEYSSGGVKTDGTAWTWGRNSDGMLGHNNRTDYSSPVQLPGTNWGTSPLQFRVIGNQRSFAIKTDGTLWTWGDNGQGNLGQNNRTRYSSPNQIPGTTWSKISGRAHCLAIKTNGTLWSWGGNSQGALGQNNRTDYSSPKQIPGTTWSFVATGDATSFAIKTDGTLHKKSIRT